MAVFDTAVFHQASVSALVAGVIFGIPALVVIGSWLVATTLSLLKVQAEGGSPEWKEGIRAGRKHLRRLIGTLILQAMAFLAATSPLVIALTFAAKHEVGKAIWAGALALGLSVGAVLFLQLMPQAAIIGGTATWKTAGASVHAIGRAFRSSLVLAVIILPMPIILDQLVHSGPGIAVIIGVYPLFMVLRNIALGLVYIQGTKGGRPWGR